MAGRPLSCGRFATLTLAAVLLQIIGLLLFVFGFFPVNPALPGISGAESYRMPTCDDSFETDKGNLLPEQLGSLYRDMSQIPSPFDRIILMVIDGLPAEFLIGRGDQPSQNSMWEAMPYTHSLLSKQRAIAYHAKAAPPTVTMPRLKAMVSGAIGGFLDVAFNFNTQAFLDDNLLDHFYRIGWKLVMFGDNTWTKLFPSLFTRDDGVSSFYVKDTVEVDFNVSRHLEAELAASDWKLMILHYLGVDHVGHIGGRHSLLMAPKLKEMDDVIKMIHIHSSLNGDDHSRRMLLVVVSDHGMTESGNHGGSSYEETDSLAVFIDLQSQSPIYAPSMRREVFQVDIAPTLALLFGVPIPKNNIGVLIIEAFNSLADEYKLRALELNSWQLLRLLQVHLPGLLCGDMMDAVNGKQALLPYENLGNMAVKLEGLYSKARIAHAHWKLHLHDSSLASDYNNFNAAVASYYEFLRNASEWLSHRATDKPLWWLLSGIVILTLSSIILLHLLFVLFKEDRLMRSKFCFPMRNCCSIWHLDKVFVIFAALVHVVSLGSSSFVEEEQYTWHFLTSTLYIVLLYTAVHSFLKEKKTVPLGRNTEEKFNLRGSQVSHSSAAGCTLFRNLVKPLHSYYQLCSLLTVLICGRILRGWHQGGVNWAHLPDISKWLEQAGSSCTKAFGIASLLLMMLLSLLALSLLTSRTRLVLIASISLIISSFLVLMHFTEKQIVNVSHVNHRSTLIAQMSYIIFGISAFGTFFILPWILDFHYLGSPLMKSSTNSYSCSIGTASALLGIQDSLYQIGMIYASSWCLLQLLLQQPIAALYHLGMAGHFGLGNSNSLATIDVAGAFMGTSSYSIISSGILMFIITFASSTLTYLSMVVSISTKNMVSLSISNMTDLGYILKRMIAFPCLLPLALNSLVLMSFTLVLLLMRNHLFVWSVFSPKYLYVCVGTASVYLGVLIVSITVVYTCSVFFLRANLLKFETPRQVNS
ncbi:hypothetical protein HPP92_005653 [Vanilla planifolia]|uniref:GPI ethanolamine phosphate transferase 2 C-terminal domain-containing protein n=1 Tax=Vanilla planifolia TaxID=51239 RepID=A0A835RN46_VANPL|nr:hypothetical protein HPP92_005653 [Vanilla planifolia]